MHIHFSEFKGWSTDRLATSGDIGRCTRSVTTWSSLTVKVLACTSFPMEQKWGWSPSYLWSLLRIERINLGLSPSKQPSYPRQSVP